MSDKKEFEKELKNMEALVFNCKFILPGRIVNPNINIKINTEESKMTQETKPVQHVHHDKIVQWAADPSAAWQYNHGDGWFDFEIGSTPGWVPTSQYRHKPRWFDMEQEWIAKGKPPVEMLELDGEWVEVDPQWAELAEYRFAIVSRHAALKAEWEAKGRPVIQVDLHGAWNDVNGEPEWNTPWTEAANYRIKPTPHPSADVLRALAEDKNLIIEFAAESLAGECWLVTNLNDLRLRIKP